jgi:hypothetical protein
LSLDILDIWFWCKQLRMWHQRWIRFPMAHWRVPSHVYNLIARVIFAHLLISKCTKMHTMLLVPKCILCILFKVAYYTITLNNYDLKWAYLLALILIYSVEVELPVSQSLENKRM